MPTGSTGQRSPCRCQMAGKNASARRAKREFTWADTNKDGQVRRQKAHCFCHGASEQFTIVKSAADRLLMPFISVLMGDTCHKARIVVLSASLLRLLWTGNFCQGLLQCCLPSVQGFKLLNCGRAGHVGRVSGGSAAGAIQGQRDGSRGGRQPGVEGPRARVAPAQQGEPQVSSMAPT